VVGITLPLENLGNSDNISEMVEDRGIITIEECMPYPAALVTFSVLEGHFAV